LLQNEKKIDSWATAMNIDFIKRDLLCVVPKKNFIQNIGFDGSGTHTGITRKNSSNKASLHKKQILNFEEISLTRSTTYDMLVRKDNSLLRDFPKGSFIRQALILRRIYRRLLIQISRIIE
jgi:hypothetical protein